MRKLFPALLLITAMIMSACGGSQSKAPESPKPAENAGSAAPAAAKKPTQGVSDTEILLGNHNALSGPGASIGLPGYKVNDAFWKYINDKGGINGRKVRWIVEDDQYNPQKTVVAVKKLVEQDKVFAIVAGLGGSQIMATREYLIQKNVPHFLPGTGTGGVLSPPAPGWYGANMTYFYESRIHVAYAVETLKLKKLAVYYQNDDNGKEYLEGFRAAAKKHGAEIVAEVSYNLATDVDFSAHAIKLKGSGAEAVLCMAVHKPFASAVKETKKLGYTPVWINATVGASPESAALLGADMDGVYGVYMALDLNDPSDPIIKEWRENMPKYAPDAPMNLTSLRSWITMRLAAEVLTRAGKDLTVESLDKAAQSVKDWGPLKISWSDAKRVGLTQMAMGRWQGDGLKKISDIISAE